MLFINKKFGLDTSLIRAIILFYALFFMKLTYAQEKENWFKENAEFSGYIKYLNTSSFENFDSFWIDNLLHNRINLKLYLGKNFRSSIEIRNRVFWGNSVQNIPDYASLINNDSHDIDLSTNIINEPALLFHSKIDRLYLEYTSGKWQFTLGRQRINWGKNLVWNPNDLFNTYSFVDFDYEERPGADALRIQYFLSGDSSIESVINYTNDWQDNTVAVKYNFHKYDYDFQVLLAKYQKDYTIGLGWEGAIKTVGIKGEFSYFVPQEKSITNDDILIGSISIDYYFKNGISVNSAVLYNSGGIKSADYFEPSQFNSLELSVKNLMPNQWSYFFQASKALTPAINASLASIYAYELKGIFIMPQFGYAISQNWEFDLISQFYYGKQDDVFSNIQNSLFLRFRWSF